MASHILALFKFSVATTLGAKGKDLSVKIVTNSLDTFIGLTIFSWHRLKLHQAFQDSLTAIPFGTISRNLVYASFSPPACFLRLRL